MQSHEPPPPGTNGSDAIERLLRTAGPRTIPDGRRRELARAAVRDAWRDGLRSRSRRRWLTVAVPLAAAASIAVAVLLRRELPVAPPAATVVARISTATGAVRLSGPAGERTIASADVVHAGDAVETPPGVVATFALEGGGDVRQNGGTAVRWVDARRVSLERGHVYVDSGAPGRAIDVATSAGTVSDIGTRFDVRAIGDEVRVRVREGIVRLGSGSAAREVTAGQGLIVTPRGIRDEPVLTYGSDWDWILRGTRFRLEGATLERFVGWVGAEGGRRVEFHPSRLAQEHSAIVLHGSIEGLTMDEALEVAFTAAGLAYRLEGDRVIVSRAGDAAR